MPPHMITSCCRDSDRTFPALRPMLKSLEKFLQFVALVYGIVSKVPFDSRNSHAITLHAVACQNTCGYRTCTYEIPDLHEMTNDWAAIEE